MGVENLGKKHFSPANKQKIRDAVAVILDELKQQAPNLSAVDREKYGSIDEKNKLKVNKCLDYHQDQPQLQSPDVDWAEFDLDYDDRKFAESIINGLNDGLKMATDIKIVHDYDNMKDTETDYKYTIYKDESNTPGYSVKRKEYSELWKQSPAPPQPGN